MQKLEKRCPKCGWIGCLGFCRSADLPYFGRCEACCFTAPGGADRRPPLHNGVRQRRVNDQQGILTIHPYMSGRAGVLDTPQPAGPLPTDTGSEQWLRAFSPKEMNEKATNP
jgi:hypothetical protein